MATTYINLKRGSNKLVNFNSSGVVDHVYGVGGDAQLTDYTYSESIINGEPWVNKGANVNQLWVDNTCINPHLDATAWQESGQTTWHGGIELGNAIVNTTTGEITKKIGIKLSTQEGNDLVLKNDGLYINVAAVQTDIENEVTVSGTTITQAINGSGSPLGNSLTVDYDSTNNVLNFSNGTDDFDVPVGGHTYEIKTNTSNLTPQTDPTYTQVILIDENDVESHLTVKGARNVTVESNEATGEITITGPDLSHLTGAMHYRGVVSTTATVDGTGTWSWNGGTEPVHEAGDVWVIRVESVSGHPEYYAKFPAGTGEKVETGDQILYTDDTVFNIVTGENQVEDKDVVLAWGQQHQTIATVDGTDIHVSLPEQPSDTTYTFAGSVSQSSNTATITNTLTDNNSVQQPQTSTHQLTGGNNVTLTVSGNEITIDAANTHYEAKNIIGNSAIATADSTTTNQSTYLNLVEDSTVRSSHKISGTGGTTVIFNPSDGLVINSPTFTQSILSGAVDVNGITSGYYRTAKWLLDNGDHGTVNLKHEDRAGNVGSMVEFKTSSGQSPDDIEMRITYIDGGVF